MRAMAKRVLWMAAAVAALAAGCVVDNPAPVLDAGGSGDAGATTLACDDNGDISEYAADGEPIGVAEECPPQNSICTETDGGAPECRCVAHFDLATDCVGCEIGWGGEACAVCEIGYGGAACDECVGPYVEAGGECLYGALCGSDSLWLRAGDLPGATRPDEDFTAGGTTGEGTTVDLVTGLEWQKCPTGTTGDGTSCTGGDPLLVTHADAVAHCMIPYAGYADWRLPEASELQSLFDCTDGQFHVNEAYFWGLDEELWTSTEVPGSIAQYFVVTTTNFGAEPSADGMAYGICVRDSDAPDSVAPRFAIGATDGSTMIDLWAKREWRRCIYGQKWAGAACSGDPMPYDPFFESPIEDVACSDEYGGHEDWRVPDTAEMASLLAWCNEARPYFLEAFAVPLAPEVDGDVYWSSTTHPDMDYVYAFDISERKPISYAGSQELPVLCVRDPG